MKVAEIMTRKVITLTESQTLREAHELLRHYRIRHLPVVNGSRVVGIVTDRDLKRATPSLLSGVGQEAFDRVLDGTPVTKVMTRDPATTTPSASVKDVVRVLVHKRYGALPVVEDGRLVGIITNIDLLKALYEMLPD